MRTDNIVQREIGASYPEKRCGSCNGLHSAEMFCVVAMSDAFPHSVPIAVHI